LLLLWSDSAKYRTAEEEIERGTVNCFGSNYKKKEGNERNDSEINVKESNNTNKNKK